MAKDPLSELTGEDLRVLHAETRRDGVITFRGRIGSREVEGVYDPLVFSLGFRGRGDIGDTTAGEARGKSHADMVAPLLELIAWLRGQDELLPTEG